MFKLLIDTGVWVDIARDPAQHALLGVLETLVDEKRLALLVPRLVVEDFRRQRNEIAREGARRISTYFEMIDAGIASSGYRSRRAMPVVSSLPGDGANDGGAPAYLLHRIHALLTAHPPIEASAVVKSRAIERKRSRQAPFLHEVESYRTAQIFEIYADCVRSNDSARSRLAFVTANTRDFSESTHQKETPHPHIAAVFAGPGSLYFANLADALRHVAPALVTRVMRDAPAAQPPVHLQAMLEAEELLSHQLQYHLHWQLLEKIAAGSVRVVENDADSSGAAARHGVITRACLRDAIAVAKETERRYTKKNLGPWDPFELGVLTGRLSALRWMLRDHLSTAEKPQASPGTSKPPGRRKGARHTVSSPIGASNPGTAMLLSD